ncbi:hypothetical protein [Lunatibacter salilacus]|nr:hypothetical protein [Lunatibacter salilacus]
MHNLAGVDMVLEKKRMEETVYFIFEVSPEGKMENLEVTNPEPHPHLP